MKAAEMSGLVLLLALPLTVPADDMLDRIALMALNADDQRAVIRLPDGKMRVLKPGDAVPGTEAVVRQMLTDKLVLEDIVVTASGSKNQETVWLYRAANGRSRIVRLHRTLPQSEGGIRTVNPVVE